VIHSNSELEYTGLNISCCLEIGVRLEEDACSGSLVACVLSSDIANITIQHGMIGQISCKYNSVRKTMEDVS
jgi:hypothetical protein